MIASIRVKKVKKTGKITVFTHLIASIRVKKVRKVTVFTHLIASIREKKVKK